MKKLALLMALLMLITACFASCGETPSENSAAVSETQSAEPEKSTETSSVQSEETSREESKEESTEETSEELPEEYTYSTVISLGKSYTSSCEAGSSYPDTYGTELTDGLYAPTEGTGYTDEKLSGYAPQSSTTFYIIIDLGEVTDKIYAFAVDFLSTHSAGIAPPSSIGVYISDDESEWERVGRCKIPSYEDGTTQKAVCELEHSVSTRYVKFVIAKTYSWVFLDEIEVIADVESDGKFENWAEELVKIYGEESVDFSASLESISGAAVDRTENRIDIAEGRTYKIKGTQIDTHKDENGMLTDGEVSGYFEGETWVGLEGGKSDIIVTLSSKRTDIGAFEMYTYSNLYTGIAFPFCVTFYASTNGSVWTEVGRVYAPTESCEAYVYRLELENTITARYIKFSLAASEDYVCYIEEVTVISYCDEEIENTLYPDINISASDTPVYHNSSDSDYNDTKNLIKGKKPQISAAGSVDEKHYDSYYNTPVTSTVLTNGSYSSSQDIHDGSYFKFYQGASRDVFFDLGAVSAVSSFTAGFLYRSEYAIGAPLSVNVTVSENGKDWYNAGTISYKYKSRGIYRSTLELESAVRARYVCFSFEVGTWAGCDELEVFGKKNVSGVKTAEESGMTVAEKIFKGKYASPDKDILNGVRDLILIYHKDSYQRTAEEFLPLLAYTDKDGQMTDTMFDGYLFLISGELPSGQKGYNGFTASDCDWLISTLFENNNNITALEKAAGTVKETLGLGADYKFKFYLTLYDPYNSNGVDFGADLDNDGKKDKLTTNELRVAAVKYLLDKYEKALSEHTYSNIEFSGYYWYNESMDDASGDMELMNDVSDMIHEAGSQLFWIPYYLASGYSQWEEHGFDCAVMQPNYAFSLDVKESHIATTASQAKRFGMGIEIEICGDALTKEGYYDHYMTYLIDSVRYGYINDCIRMYYAEFATYIKAANSTGKNRLIYDYTYQMIKGTLDITPEKLADITVTASENTPYEGTLNAENNEIREYTVNVSPKHGTVTVCSDGKFTYYPDKDFTGTDTFEYTYNEQLGESEPCIVNITVE